MIKNTKVSLKCEECGTSFLKPLAWAKRVKHHYCSVTCHNKSQTVYPPKICSICGKEFKIARGNQSRYSTCDNPVCRQMNKTKEKNPNWRGGKTKSRKSEMSTTKYRNWRKAVFERDDFTCQICFKRGGDIEADHIKPWAYFIELRYEISNGRTLCRSCHQKTFKDVFCWRDDKGQNKKQPTLQL